MTLTEQVYAQCLVLAQKPAQEKGAMLQVLCRAAVVSLTDKLRTDLSPEDCKADFIAAASLYALAALAELDETAQLDQVTAGDITLKQKGADVASSCLRYQAGLIMTPYLKRNCTFRGV